MRDREVARHTNRLRNDSAWDASTIEVSLLGGFELRREGLVVPLPLTAQRLLAFLALQGRRSRLRVYVAGTLWPFTTDAKAAANLRSTLWRVRQPGLRVVDVFGQQISLNPGVSVDIHHHLAVARAVLDCSETSLCEAALCPDFECASVADGLLPGWYDDWVLVERERLRQVFVHALETLCQLRSSVGLHAQAVEAGLAAIAIEPLRESAQRAVVEAHLAEGNISEAVRQYRAYAELLASTLGVRPSPRMQALLGNLGADEKSHR